MTDLLDALLPLYYGSKCIGLSPYRIVSGRFEKSFLGSITTFFIAVSYFASANYVLRLLPQNNANVIVNIVVQTRIYSTLVTIMIVYFNEIIMQSDFKKIFNQLRAIDESLSEFGVCTFNSETKRLVLFLVISLYTVWLFVIILDNCVNHDDVTLFRLWISFLYVLPNLVFLISTCNMSVFIFSVKLRFSFINKQILGSVLDVLLLKFNVEYAMAPGVNLRKKQVKTIIKTKRIHYDLCIFMEKLHSIYSIPVLFILGVCYSTAFAQMYFWFTFIRHSSDGELSLVSIIHSTTVLALMLLNVVGLTSVCDLCYREGKHTAVVLFRIIAKTKDEDIVSVAKFFSMQLLNLPKPITAAGFFCIDRKLLTTMVGSTVTFMVILIQFDLAAVV